jgi:hypothetical protein
MSPPRVTDRKLYQLLVALSVSIALVTAQHSAVYADNEPGKAKDKSLYPLKKGYKWEWVGRLGGAQTKRVDEVVGVVTVDGVECYEIKTVVNKIIDGVWRKTSVKSSFVAQSEEGYFEVASYSQSTDSGFIYTRPRPIIRLPLKDIGVAVEESRKNEKKGFSRHPADKGHRSTGTSTSIQLTRKQETSVETYLGTKQEAAVVTETEDGGEEKVELRYVAGVGPKEIRITSKTNPRPGEVRVTREVLQLVYFSEDSAAIGDIVLSKDIVEREGSVESIEALPGVKTKFKKSRTISREASFSTTLGVGAEVEAKLAGNIKIIKAEASLRVKAHIEATLGEKLSDTETREQEVEIDGAITPKAKIVWIDTYRKGTIEVTQDGKPYKIPFEFPVGTKLVIRKP